mmetsp:Transcript_43756/g.133136  ORF Transcript_43756/g.133136 Transcript_43756/m.133136 type:complete len:289 (-) Transcript_43756:2-868(-)
MPVRNPLGPPGRDPPADQVVVPKVGTEASSRQASSSRTLGGGTVPQRRDVHENIERVRIIERRRTEEGIRPVRTRGEGGRGGEGPGGVVVFGGGGVRFVGEIVGEWIISALFRAPAVDVRRVVRFVRRTEGSVRRSVLPLHGRLSTRRRRRGGGGVVGRARQRRVLVLAALHGTRRQDPHRRTEEFRAVARGCLFHVRDPTPSVQRRRGDRMAQERRRSDQGRGGRRRQGSRRRIVGSVGEDNDQREVLRTDVPVARRGGESTVVRHWRGGGSSPRDTLRGGKLRRRR